VTDYWDAEYRGNELPAGGKPMSVGSGDGQVVKLARYADDGRMTQDGDIDDVRQLEFETIFGRLIRRKPLSSKRRQGDLSNLGPRDVAEARKSMRKKREQVAAAMRKQEIEASGRGEADGADASEGPTDDDDAPRAPSGPPSRRPTPPAPPPSAPPPAAPRSGILALEDSGGMAYYWDCDPSRPGQCRLVWYKTDWSFLDSDGYHSCIVSDKCTRQADGKYRFEAQAAALAPTDDPGMRVPVRQQQAFEGTALPEPEEDPVRRQAETDAQLLRGSALVAAAPEVPRDDELTEPEREAKAREVTDDLEAEKVIESSRSGDAGKEPLPPDDLPRPAEQAPMVTTEVDDDDRDDGAAGAERGATSASDELRALAEKELIPAAAASTPSSGPARSGTPAAPDGTPAAPDGTPAAEARPRPRRMIVDVAEERLERPEVRARIRARFGLHLGRADERADVRVVPLDFVLRQLENDPDLQQRVRREADVRPELNRPGLQEIPRRVYMADRGGRIWVPAALCNCYSTKAL